MTWDARDVSSILAGSLLTALALFAAITFYAARQAPSSQPQLKPVPQIQKDQSRVRRIETNGTATYWESE